MLASERSINGLRESGGVSMILEHGMGELVTYPERMI